MSLGGILGPGPCAEWQGRVLYRGGQGPGQGLGPVQREASQEALYSEILVDTFSE